jgi:excisionase family DNA binding protein
MMNEKYLTLAEVASRLTVSLHTVRRWASERRIPTARLGRTVRVPEAALEHWLTSKAEPARDDR